jgi:hypothetical protein
MNGSSVNLAALPDTATVISVLIGTVLPWLTGRVTKVTAHPKVRGIVLLALAASTSVLSELGQVIATGATYDAWHVVLGALGTYALGVVMHSGLYRHLGAYQANAATGGVIGPAVVAVPHNGSIESPKGP